MEIVAAEISNVRQITLRDRVAAYFELTKPRIARPNYKTDEPVCPEGQLQCGDNDCIDKVGQD